MCIWECESHWYGSIEGNRKGASQGVLVSSVRLTLGRYTILILFNETSLTV